MSPANLEYFEESAIIQAAQAGSSEAFEEIVKRYHNRVIAFCVLELGSTEWGKDAAQETFLSIFRSLTSFRAESSFKAWVFGIAHNRCIDLVRKRNKSWREIAECAQSNHVVPSAENSILNADLCRKILASLPKDARELFLMKEAAGLSYEELAQHFNVTIESIRGKLKRTRAQLIELIGSLMYSREN